MAESEKKLTFLTEEEREDLKLAWAALNQALNNKEFADKLTPEQWYRISKVMSKVVLHG